MDYRRTGFFCSVELQKYVVFEPYGPISHMLLCVWFFSFFFFYAFSVCHSVSLHRSGFGMD